MYPAPKFGNAARQPDEAWIDFFLCQRIIGDTNGYAMVQKLRRFEGNGRYNRWPDGGDTVDYLLGVHDRSLPSSPPESQHVHFSFHTGSPVTYASHVVSKSNL